MAKEFKICETCSANKTVIGCLFCEKFVCMECSANAEYEARVFVNRGERICGKKCGKRHRRENRERV